MSNKLNNPHDEITVKDNTFNKKTKTTNTGLILFQPIASLRGDDSCIKTWDDYEEFIAENGEPDLDKTGQGMYHAALWLKNGGIAKTYRLTAENAVRANINFLLNIKIVDVQKVDGSNNPLYKDSLTGADTLISTNNDPVMIKKAIVKWSKKGLVKASTDKIDMRSIMNSMYAETTEGVTFPMITSVCKGKGNYGGMYRMRITSNAGRDGLTHYRNYYLEIMKNDNGLATIDNSPANVSFYPSALYNKTTYYAPDVVDRNTDYPLKLFTVPEYWAQVTDMLLPVLQQTNPNIVAEDIDFIMFRDSNLKQYANIDIDPESLDLTALEGYGLMNGDDGDFKLTNKTRKDAIHNRLLDLFDGEITGAINDTKEHIINLALDANYPLEVKKSMVAWRAKRKDFPLLLDAGELYSKAAVVSFLKEDMRPDDRSVFINTQTFDTTDPYSGKIIRVTQNYLYAALFASHVANAGISTPFAGIDVPLNDYIIPESLRPILSEEEDKSEIYGLRGNYIEKTDGIYNFGSNVTSQIEDSECSYLNNMFVLYKMMAKFKTLGAKIRWKKITTTEDLNTLQKLGDKMMEGFIGSDITNGAFSIAKSTTDPRGKTVKTRIGVGFNEYLLDNEMEFDIERL